MASSRFSQLCTSGLERASCHGETCDGNAGSRNVRVSQKPQHIPQRVSTNGIASSSRPGESESIHGDGVRARTAADCCGRREVGVASVAFLLLSLTGNQGKDDAARAAGFDKYLKRKKLDPLDTYVPTVLLAQSQFQEVDGKLDEGGEQKKYSDARSLLRTGPAASLRTDIRAVAQYAAETGSDDGTAASAAVDQCLSALEDLDSLLFQASRSQGAPVERMRKDLTMTVSALDRLLATVPAPILEKSRAIADAYKEATY